MSVTELPAVHWFFDAQRCHGRRNQLAEGQIVSDTQAAGALGALVPDQRATDPQIRTVGDNQLAEGHLFDDAHKPLALGDLVPDHAIGAAQEDLVGDQLAEGQAYSEAQLPGALGVPDHVVGATQVSAVGDNHLAERPR